MNTCYGHVLLSFVSKEQFDMMIQNIPQYHPKPDLKGFKSTAVQIIGAGG